jgi:hypothetical protein
MGEISKVKILSGLNQNAILKDKAINLVCVNWSVNYSLNLPILSMLR